MDAGGDVSVLLSEANSSGSGNDDYAVLVPISNFAGLNPATTYIYLYVQMGAADGPANGPSNTWTVQGGFEEWNLQNALILQGTKFVDTANFGVRDAGEVGLGGVTIFIDDDLDGVAEATDGDGILNNGERFTVTNSDLANGPIGSYSFGSIPILGKNNFSYTIQICEVVPTGYAVTTGAFKSITISAGANAGSILTVDPIGNRPLTPNFTIVKSITSVTGGVLAGAPSTAPTAAVNTAGDIINYQIVLTNNGELALTAPILADKLEDTLNATGFVLNGTIVKAGGDQDSDFEVGETWTYTASYTVKQSDLDTAAAVSLRA